MPRRFITAEDIRRVQGGELVVDEQTLVTPQALEVAQALGVAIKTAAGEYTEPEPDRGPDAGRALAHMPHMPEPRGDGAGTGVVITALGRNRPGVLAEITKTLAEQNVSIDDVSQKMVSGYFHMALVVQMPPGASFEQLKACVECLGGEDDYVVHAMHERVFRFMHRI